MLTSIFFFRGSIVSLVELISAYLSLLLLGLLVCTHDFYWNFIVFVYIVCILCHLPLTKPHSRCTYVDPLLTCLRLALPSCPNDEVSQTFTTSLNDVVA